MFACEISGRLVGGAGGTLKTNFIYDENRPFEVRLQSVTGVDVVFARELLALTFSQPAAGEGWIRFHIAADRFLMRFGYDLAVSYVSYPLIAVEDFRKKMYELVPWGTAKMDIDALWQDFLNDKI